MISCYQTFLISHLPLFGQQIILKHQGTRALLILGIILLYKHVGKFVFCQYEIMTLSLYIVGCLVGR